MSTSIHRQGFQLLDEVVRDYCMRINDPHLTQYVLVYNHMVAGLREFNYDIMNSPKRAYLEVDTTLRRAWLPEDFVNYVQVGFCFNGNVIALGSNKKMCAPPDNCGNRPAVQHGNVKGGRFSEKEDADSYFAQGYFLESVSRNGGFQGRLYGHGGGYNRHGYYNVNKSGGFIDFSSEMTLDQVVLDYISDGYEVGKTTYIHVFAKEALIEYAFWKMAKYRPNKDVNDHRNEQSGRRDFFREKRTLLQRMTSFPLYEFTAAGRRGYKGTAKN